MLAGLSPDTLRYYMRYFSDWLGLPSDTLENVARIESSFNPQTGTYRNTCNYMNACGLMQLRPNALADIRRVTGMQLNPLDPIHAIVGAAVLFWINRQYIFNSVKRAPDLTALLIAYNGGWVAGRTYMLKGIVPSAESRTYLAKFSALAQA